MENLISKEKIAKYRSISSEALEKAKVSINKEKKKEAAEIIEMVSCYLSDSNHFESKGDYVNAFAALSYSKLQTIDFLLFNPLLIFKSQVN